jgi:hypothetical protein
VGLGSLLFPEQQRRVTLRVRALCVFLIRGNFQKFSEILGNVPKFWEILGNFRKFALIWERGLGDIPALEETVTELRRIILATEQGTSLTDDH